MQRYQRKDQRLEVLHEIIEDTEPLGVLRLLDVHQRADLGRLERDVLVAHADLEFLAAVFVLLRPFAIVFPGTAGWLSGGRGEEEERKSEGRYTS